MAQKEKKYQNLKNFHKNRFKILIWSVLIILPLSLILIAYLGPYITYSSVHFNDETGEVVRAFDSIDDLELINLKFDWLRLRNPIFDENGDVTTTGYYQFSFNYQSLDTYDITSVVVTPVLQTDWFDYSSMGSAQTLIEDRNTNMVVSFNYELPQSRLLFVTVTDPILYLKIVISYDLQGEVMTKTEYVEIPLTAYNPERVD